MSVSVRIEIPSHSYVTNVDVSASATVLELKRTISEQCEGKPAVEGQRLIAKGRVLQDSETVDALWSPHDIKVVFVAVNPTSWTSTPPANLARPPLPSLTASPSVSSTSIPTSITASQSTGGLGMSTISQRAQPLSYVQYLHTNALLALQRAPLVSVPAWDVGAARDWSKLIVESYGFEWPKVLEEDFPGTLSTVYPPKGGVFYRSQYSNGYPYMSLSPKSTEPTPLQARALEILTYTFPLLSSTFQPMYCPTWISASQMLMPHLGAATSGIAGVHNPIPGRAQRNPAVFRPQLPNFPFRAFAFPFLMLSIRTIFLLYIFSPARKPIFALMLAVWLVWELWTAAQGVIAEERAAARPQNAAAGDALRNRNEEVANGDAGPNGGGGGGGEAAPVANAPQPQPGNGNGGGNNNRRNNNRWDPNQIALRVAVYKLGVERLALNAEIGSPNARPPTTFERLRRALILFFLTIHPEVWNKRRRLLLEREASIKRELAERRRRREAAVEAETNAEPDEGGGENTEVTPQERPQVQTTEFEPRRRDPWLEEYIERVERAEWVDG